MRRKLEKFFKSLDIEIKYLNLVTKEHYGGRSFYNDGTYQEEVYKLTKDDKVFYLYDKCTGRPMFTLEDEQQRIILLDVSQDGFIERFKREIKL